MTMTVWCHRHGCDNLIRNDEDFLGTPEGNRTHVQVDGIPFCMDCYDDEPTGPQVAGVPVDPDKLKVVIGGYPAKKRSATAGEPGQ